MLKHKHVKNTRPTVRFENGEQWTIYIIETDLALNPHDPAYDPDAFRDELESEYSLKISASVVTASASLSVSVCDRPAPSDNLSSSREPIGSTFDRVIASPKNLSAVTSPVETQKV